MRAIVTTKNVDFLVKLIALVQFPYLHPPAPAASRFYFAGKTPIKLAGGFPLVIRDATHFCSSFLT